MDGVLLVISGPSGAGKSSLIKKLLELIPDSVFSVSTTTRKIRDGEKDGINYYFVSKEEFEKDIENGMFLEFAKVHENYYGTSLKTILNFLKEGKTVILDIDVQGHNKAKEKFDRYITSVFVTTASKKVLEQRLNNRKTDSKDEIKKRLKNASNELSHMDSYDYLIINDDLQKAANELFEIAKSAKNRTKKVEAKKFITDWHI